MTALAIRPQDRCRWDLLALGEVMLRLDPGDGRIATAREFRVWEGGGEYNVARGLRRCFGMRTAVVTALADNAVGRLVEDLIRQGGVETAHLHWAPHDGVGRSTRNGLNFVERGFGVRGAFGVSDRGNTAVSQLQVGDIDWDTIFDCGVRWFHCGGVFAALSKTTAAVAAEAIDSARRHGAIVSYDLNYRPSLWESFGGAARAAVVNRTLVERADVLFGNEQGFATALGVTPTKAHGELSLEVLQAVMDGFPSLAAVAATRRREHSASRNDWSAVALTRDGPHLGPVFTELEIFDRIGGGDSFASGFIYGLLTSNDPEVALSYGVAHGALAMTTPGDSSMATLTEVDGLIAGNLGLVLR